MKGNWGGARKGSGRKPLPDELKRQGYTFQLSKDELEFIESFDGNSRSEKLRELIKQYKILENRLDFSSGE